MNGEIPVLNWLNALRETDHRAYTDCVARVELLSALGHELRRPHADYLRDGIYELRARSNNVNYRILYFFFGRNVAILAHGLTKQKEVPAFDIKRAVQRKQLFEKNPQGHTGHKEICYEEKNH